MPLGKLKRIDNLARRFGSVTGYWFVKIQSVGNNEEHWLVTDREREKFLKRATKNPEDLRSQRRGALKVVENTQRRFGSDISYFSVVLKEKGGEREHWLLTAPDLERVRCRVDKNKEDIDANKEGWLADLMD